MKKLQEFLGNGRADVLWYSFCFALLGLIDQRRGSAEGLLQMVFVNFTGIVVGMLLLPSMQRRFWCTKPCKIWSAVCVPGIIFGCVWGYRFWANTRQWYVAVANAAVLGYLIIYIWWNRKEIREKSRLNLGCFFMIAIMLALMQLSVHEVLWPGWFLCLFGCFYLIGMPKDKEEFFIEGMLLGIIMWFFIQQAIAFGFRPYDYVRYKGLYSGETQNGTFYMVVFCAFTGMWLLLKKRKAKPVWRILCFLLSAGSVSFQLLTGGRASFLGIAGAAVLAYMAYDILVDKSFRHWIVQGIALAACIIVLLPAVYGCIRYLPTILHHPIWFEGEYNADTSVHSYDPWNSERYISFRTSMRENVGRLLEIVGIQLFAEDGRVSVRTPATLTAYAAAAEEPGSSPENPFIMEETDFESSISIRRTIYYYYTTHLNLMGHHKADAGFYMEDGNYYGHAHNMFLQMAYDYGILVGILFLGWNLWCLVRLLLRKDIQGIICAAFLAAILIYGCAEMAVTTGQITMVLLFLIYYFGSMKVERIS